MDFTRLAALERALAFNLSGHILHSIFWQNMSPNGGGLPQGPLAEAIQKDFGGFDHFRKQIVESGIDDHGLGMGGAGLGASW